MGLVRTSAHQAPGRSVRHPSLVAEAVLLVRGSSVPVPPGLAVLENIGICWPKAESRWQRPEEPQWPSYSRAVPGDLAGAEMPLQVLPCLSAEPGEHRSSGWLEWRQRVAVLG